MYVNNGHNTHVQDIMYLKWRREKDTNNPHYIPQKEHSPCQKSPMLTPPNYDYSHNQNYSPFLSRVIKGKSIK